MYVLMVVYSLSHAHTRVYHDARCCCSRLGLCSIHMRMHMHMHMHTQATIVFEHRLARDFGHLNPNYVAGQATRDTTMDDDDVTV